jgi:protein SCO1/2
MSGLSADRDFGRKLTGWLGHPYFPVGACGLVGLWTGLFVAAPVLGEAAPVWLEPLQRLCGYNPAAGVAPLDRTAILVTQGYLTIGVLAFLFWGDLRRVLAVDRRAAVLFGFATALPAALLVAGIVTGRLAVFPAGVSALTRQVAPAPDFTLVDQAGQPVSLSGLRGRVVVLTFFYAHCPDICPPLLARLQQVVEDARQRGLPVVGVGITLDPGRDSPAALADFAGQFGLGDGIRLLSGRPDALETVYAAYGIDPTVLSNNLIVHPGRFYLIDRQGRLAYVLPAGDVPQPWLTNVIRLLAREEGT